MIDVKAITRSLPVAKTSQRAIETIAEPIDAKTHNGGGEGQGEPSGEGITHARHDHADEPDRCQVIGIHPIGHATG